MKNENKKDVVKEALENIEVFEEQFRETGTFDKQGIPQGYGSYNGFGPVLSPRTHYQAYSRNSQGKKQRFYAA